MRLNGAAGIHLQPLDPRQAAVCLHRDAGGDHTTAGRWAAVIAQMGTDTPVGQALSTPLGLFLARTTYNPRLRAPQGGFRFRNRVEIITRLRA
ncbi:hypothetical protein [Streptomyces radiopugnans]|uniref:Uncharacterized protein n=1 Tax=Streptomyces radiopugnans TaxID=403935 RepID=A0A1H9JDJ5_9ACTN|nr:hypothetical protein [Streptomyces radiopugnans]SEQ84984.1 hypothetical protein SAMN05216481_11751 [Streptomyces radiopugnans]